MIVVNAALKKEEIKQALAEVDDPSFTFQKEQGMQLFFETNESDLEEATSIAKNAIKKKIGKSIMFSVKAV